MSIRRGRAGQPAPAPGDTGPLVDRTERIANSFGLLEALLGIVAGFILTMIAVAAYAAATHRGRHPSQFGEDVVGLLALWAGFVGAVVAATRTRVASGPADGRGDGRGVGREAWTGDSVEVSSRPRGTGSVIDDYGLRLRPWPDVPLGIVAGLASQYLLVPALEFPVSLFVPDLYHRLGHPARSLTGHAFGPGLALLAVLVCVGSPIVEELFFRGLLLRALLGRFRDLGPKLAPAASIVGTALVFALVHFEALQFVGLAGFGVVLGFLAWRTGRLGSSIVAHMAFNTVTIIAIVVTR